MNPPATTPGSDTWRANADAPAIARRLHAAQHVLLLTHYRPDGDAIGSTLALARTLQRLGKSVLLWYVGPIPAWAAATVNPVPVRWLEPGINIHPDALWLEPRPPQPTQPPSPTPPSSQPDTILTIDTGSWSQLSEARDWLRPRADRNIVIDHHLHGDADIAPLRLIDTSVAAAAQLVAAVAQHLLELPSPANLPIDIATPLYLGIATDTGWFRHSNTTPPVLRLAADLLDAGVDHPALYQLVEQNDSPGRLRLMSRALASLELTPDARVALFTLRAADFNDAHADRNDSGGFADLALNIASVQVAAVLTEGDPRPGQPPLVKISLRSKPGPDAVDVNTVARALGGGGHARAAGAKIHASLEHAKAALLNALAAPPP